MSKIMVSAVLHSFCIPFWVESISWPFPVPGTLHPWLAAPSLHHRNLFFHHLSSYYSVRPPASYKDPCDYIEPPR